MTSFFSQKNWGGPPGVARCSSGRALSTPAPSGRNGATVESWSNDGFNLWSIGIFNGRSSGSFKMEVL